jgi:hypothetical protein
MDEHDWIQPPVDPPVATTGGPVSTEVPVQDYIPGQFWQHPVVQQRDWTEAAMKVEISTPFRAEVFREYLAEYPFSELKEYVCKGIEEGFDTGVNLPEERVMATPLKSAIENPEEVSKWLAEEVGKGHITVSKEPPHKYFRACPIGLVPKPPAEDGSLRWRFISDFSREGPEGEPALNGGIDGNEYRLKMISVWDVIDCMAEMGEECTFSAIDCEWGYRQLPVHPDVVHCQTYLWDDKFYSDLRLVFGSSSSPAIYNSGMECVEWIVQTKVDEAVGQGQARIKHYLDDFIAIAKNAAVSERATEVMLQVFQDLGIPLSHAKSQLNVQKGKYLGLWLNSAEQRLSIPSGKREVILAELEDLGDEGGTAWTKTRLESLVGRLTWGHAQWFASRPLINPLLHALAKQTHRLGRIKMSKGLRRTARDWVLAIEVSPPRHFRTRPRALAVQMLNLNSSVLDVKLEAAFCGDSSAEHGFGWYNKIAVRCGRWEEGQRVSAAKCGGVEDVGLGPVKNSSTLQELRCLADAVQYWVAAGKREDEVCVYFTDAFNLVHLFRKGRSRVKLINQEMWRLGLILREKGLAVRVVWQRRNGSFATAADCLSRGWVDAGASAEKCMLNGWVSCVGGLGFMQVIPEHPGIYLNIGDSNKEA